MSYVIKNFPYKAIKLSDIDKIIVCAIYLLLFLSVYVYPDYSEDYSRVFIILIILCFNCLLIDIKLDSIIHSMASSTNIEILKAYRDLVDWATTTAGTPGRTYVHEGSSLEDAGGNVPTDERYNNSASSDSTNYVAIIRGWIYPSNASFNGQGLPIEIRVPDGYPAEPPEVYMRIQLRHPNIEKNGIENIQIYFHTSLLCCRPDMLRTA